MIQLTIDNSTCNLSGLNQKQTSEIRELMSYTVDSNTMFFKQDFRSNKRSLFTKRGDFPSGLLYIAIQFLNKNKLKGITKDKTIVPKHAQMGLQTLFNPSMRLTPYPEQIEAAKACLNAYKGKGIIVAPTGLGKSLIAALICDQFQVPTLIVVPSLELKNQLTVTLRQYFAPWMVGPLDKSGQRQHFITVENIDALKIDAPVKGIDLVIIDEFHHSGAKTYRELNKKAWSNIYYKFGMTATAFRSNENERLLLESVLSHVIYRVNYKDAVRKGYIVPMEAYYYELSKTKVTGVSWPQVYSELIVNNIARNAIITEILNALNKVSLSTLCLVKEIKHGTNLVESTGYTFVKGENDNNKETILAYNVNEFTTLIGTTGIIGEGVDTRPTEYVIIAGLGKSKNAFMQAVGRGFRTYTGKETCKIIIFLDKSHKWTKAHFAAQVKYLTEEYGVIPIKINY